METKMSETVFILGAGASKGAGAPLMNEFFDTADELRKKLPAQDADFELVFHARDALQSVYSKATMDLLNFESVFAAFEMAKLLRRLGSLSTNEIEALPGAMTRLIQRTLEATIAFPVENDGQHPRILTPRPYDQLGQLAVDLSRQPNGMRRIAFITFNYDICLDFALFQRTLPVDYCLGPMVGHGVKLMKLHGSLNWSRCGVCGQVIALEVRDFLRDKFLFPLDHPQIHILISTGLERLTHCNAHLSSEPFMAPPTWNKTQYHTQLESVWRAAAQELSEAENIFICGYSLPDTDQFFRYLYALGTVGRSGLKKFCVINPDEEVGRKFRGLCGPLALSRFTFYSDTIENSLNSVRGFVL